MWDINAASLSKCISVCGPGSHKKRRDLVIFGGTGAILLGNQAESWMVGRYVNVVSIRKLQYFPGGAYPQTL